MTVKKLLTLILALGIGAMGGWAASLIHVPMPWLIGALVACGLWSSLAPTGLAPSWMPRHLRTPFIGVIGVAIGGMFTGELLASLPGWWPGILGVVVFALIAHLFIYLIYRRVGEFDSVTAFYAASPGGFVENIVMAEAAGADVALVSLMQFLRVTMVIILLPVGLSLWFGQVVGSAAGTAFSDVGGAALTPEQFGIMVLVGVIGLAAGLGLKIPAGAVIGPIILSAIAHLTGVLTAHPPDWAIIVAQIVVGVSLGMRFGGLTLSLIRKGAGMALVSVVMMMSMATGIGLFLSALTDFGTSEYVMSLAPAGVIEMSLVAITVGGNPVFVTTHHIIRIFVTVLISPMIYHRWFAPR